MAALPSQFVQPDPTVAFEPEARGVATAYPSVQYGGQMPHVQPVQFHPHLQFLQLQFQQLAAMGMLPCPERIGQQSFSSNDSHLGNSFKNENSAALTTASRKESFDNLKEADSASANSSATVRVDHSRKGRRLNKEKVSILERWAEKNCKGDLLRAPKDSSTSDCENSDCEAAETSGDKSKLGRSGWTITLAEKTGLSPRQVKEWVRRWRCRKFREMAQSLGIRVPTDARLTRNEFAKLIAREKVKQQSARSD